MSFSQSTNKNEVGLLVSEGSNVEFWSLCWMQNIKLIEFGEM